MSKHPYELNCSRELGHKTKTYPFEPSFLLYFSDSNFLSFQSLSSCLLEFLKNVKLPQTSFLPLFFFFEISGNLCFLGRSILWDGFLSLLVIFNKKACSGSIIGTKVYASAYK